MSGNIGGVDASIPLQAGKGVQQPNPLQQIGQFAEIQNLLNTNKLFPGQQQLQQQQIQGNQNNLIQQSRQQGAAALAPLLAKRGLLGIDDVTTALAAAEKSGIVTQPALADFQGIPLTGDPAVDDAAIRAHILAGAQAPAAAAGTVLPHLATVDVGPAIQPVTVGAPGLPGAGVMTPAGGAFQKGLTPEGATTPTQIGVTPQGAPIVGTRQQFIDKTQGASPFGTGRLPAALAGPNASAAAATPGGVVTGVGPAKEAQLQAQGNQSATAFQNIANQGVQARGQNSILGTMLADTSQFTTGPVKLNELNATLQRYTPSLAQAFGIKPEQVSANESFDKLANQIADAQGAGSDARLAVIQHANPGSQLSPAGVDSIIRQLQGNADYLQARAQLAAKYPDQTDRAGFEASVGAKLDPRAFQFARMTPQQKVDYVNSIKSDADRKALRTSYNYAVQNGLIGG